MAEPVVLVDRDADVVTITLNRAEAANAFSVQVLDEFDAALHEIAGGDARVVIVTATGEKVFCAGADLKERAGMSGDQAIAVVTRIRETINAVARLPMPTIAAINGGAFGGGLELALACDVRVLAPGAQVGLTEATLAIIPGGGGTQRLARLIGPGRAKELIFTGRRVGADEALRIGIVEEIGEPDAITHARRIADAIAANGPIAVRAAKEAIERGLQMPLDEALFLETELYGRTVGTKDRLEGLSAFKEKRKPVYRGE